MATQREFFEQVLGSLESLGLPHMVVGSVGCMLYGEPRLTNDMDVVVELGVEGASSLARMFASAEYYFPPIEAVHEAISRRGQFNIIHIPSGSKVDLILRKDSRFAQEEFSRRRSVVFSDRIECVSATPEDLIVAKLRSFREGGGEKHLRDIGGVLSVSSSMLDMAYIETWVGALGLADEWERAKSGGL